ncbi:MAG: Thymidylate kinase [Ignavibacteriae bacterium]|nr:MAG: Thymidylate kinase [Ignavibacteriota bacterium]
MLISFEGLDFSGKTTQIKLLVEKLQRHKFSVVLVREPGGTAISEKIREILLDKKYSEMTEIAELLLFSAARTQLVSEVILPAVQSGKIVICDRFVDSTTAYQGYGRGINLDAVNQINKLATHSTMPDITFFIDIPLTVITQRLMDSNSSTDRMEAAGKTFFEKTRNGYINIAKNEPNRFIIIDGNRDIDIIHEEVWNIVRSRLNIP